MQDNHIRVGVGLLIIKGDTILLGQRKAALGTGQYGATGGHVEYGETLQDAVLRELAEEAGVQVKNVRFLCVSDFLTHMPERHYVDVGFVADWESGDPQLLEPHKCEGWDWYDRKNVPKNLFGVMAAYLEAYETGQRYFTFLPQADKNNV
jgi:8-oxo-dGTP diphosphatase